MEDDTGPARWSADRQPEATKKIATTNTRSKTSSRRGAGRALQVHTAPTWRRWIAMLIDSLPLLTIWALGAAALSAASAEPVPLAPWNLLDRAVDYINARPGVAVGAALLFAVLLFALPLALQLLFGSTPGKRIMGIALVDRRGERPSPRRQLAHCTLRVLSVGLLFGGVLWALADPERRTLHDRLAGIWPVVAGRPAQKRR